MPELPEVETVRRGLLPAMEGRVIERAEVNRPDLRWPLPDNMAARLTGARILRLRRRSKYILADLDRGETLLIHLGMSGRMLVSGVALGEFVIDHPTPQKHDHIVFHMEGGGRVTFNDARRFGAMDLFPTGAEDSYWLLEKLGPEPFSNQLNEEYLTARLRSRASPIKTLLLDQAIVAGLGNIYVCEVLFRAGIDPRRQGRQIAEKRLRPLVAIIREVLEEAIEAGGSSLRDHRQADGELGYFQHRFKVYGREGAPCQSCGQPVLRIVQSGRSSFYCAHCQR
ncbi:bifunctional DNA-formamidopyrimidine glycosylase/DNA-(apurinic or apyrimidinic site) lyase [Thioclava sp. GXIMD2076]|uniref:bifunctional DNA-formamidopyrimidine glycosylase/DNA-(apurinic or apyrimidinic site) lyase n=1 Tax=Thioclava sp. GXIMD2076 TaxID=3131931 RepID=UPI0030D57620